MRLAAGCGGTPDRDRMTDAGSAGLGTLKPCRVGGLTPYPIRVSYCGG